MTKKKLSLSVSALIAMFAFTACATSVDVSGGDSAAQIQEAVSGNVETLNHTNALKERVFYDDDLQPFMICFVEEDVRHDCLPVEGEYAPTKEIEVIQESDLADETLYRGVREDNSKFACVGLGFDSKYRSRHFSCTNYGNDGAS